MAYMSQDNKRRLVALAKPVLKKYGVKATFSTDRSGISCNIKSSKLDFITNYRETMSDRGMEVNSNNTYMQVNPYHFKNHYTGNCLNFLTELMEALYNGNHDNSDITTDYFDVGWYVHVNVGRWDKPYVLES